ncbi:hypothetical protein MKEN_00991300 [Mycena kentingensis (nom. inval.)]|nr:hypothetical protein MKEN_00991300 [Mycena kentingensis (nom. inval.)]
MISSLPLSLRLMMRWTRLWFWERIAHHTPNEFGCMGPMAGVSFEGGRDSVTRCDQRAFWASVLDSPPAEDDDDVWSSTLVLAGTPYHKVDLHSLPVALASVDVLLRVGLGEVPCAMAAGVRVYKRKEKKRAESNARYEEF